MFVASATVNIFAGYAQANHRRLAEAGLIGAGLHEILKDIAVQLAKVFGHAEAVLVFIMLQQQHAKIIIPHIRREVIADDTGMALTGFYRQYAFAGSLSPENWRHSEQYSSRQK